MKAIVLIFGMWINPQMVVGLAPVGGDACQIIMTNPQHTPPNYLPEKPVNATCDKVAEAINKAMN